MQINMTAMHNMIAEFSSQITADQRKKPDLEATRIQEKRQENKSKN